MTGIEIRGGFLSLTTEEEKRTVYYKGSSIIGLEPSGKMHGGADFGTSGTLVMVADSIAPLVVRESIDQILAAIQESYKQVARSR